jgi:hypothetical protein
VGVIVALVLLQVVALAVVAGGARDQDLRVRGVEALRAQYAAEAAAQMALRELARNADEDGDGVVGGVSSNAAGGRTFNLGSMRATATGSGPVIVSVTGSNGLARRATQLSVRQNAASAGLAGLAVETWTLGTSPGTMAGVNWNATPTSVGILPWVNFPSTGSGNMFVGSPTRFAMRLRGQVNIPTAGSWTFFLNSDDGSDLWINGTRVINNDGPHGMREYSAAVTLPAGWADIEIRYWDQGGSAGLILSWSGSGVAKQVIPRQNLRCIPAATVPPVAVTGQVTLTGDGSANAANIDGYNVNAGTWSWASRLTSATVLSTNASAAASVQMTNGSTVYGNVRVGTSTNPSGAVSQSGGASVTGTITGGSPTQALFRPSPPTAPASSGAYSLNNGSATLSSNARYTSVSLSGGSTLTVQGDVTVHVDGDLTLGGTSRIVLAAGARLTIWASGNVYVNNDAEINSGGVSSDVLIVMLGNALTFRMTSKSLVNAHVLNPRGPAVINGQSNNASSFQGVLRASQLTMTDKTQIHGEVSLGAGGSSSGISILSWGESP